MTIIESGNLSDRRIFMSIQKRRMPPLWFFMVCAVNKKTGERGRLAFIFQIDHFYEHTKKRGPLFCVYKNGSSFREGKGAWDFGSFVHGS